MIKRFRKIIMILVFALCMAENCAATQHPLEGDYRVINTHFGMIFDMKITQEHFFQYPYRTYRIDQNGTVHMTVFEFGEVPRDFFVEIRDGFYYFFRQNSNNEKYQLILIGAKKEVKQDES